jgi:hypothetical protein
MTVGLLIDNVIYDLGPPDLVHAVFSTIGANLEKTGWGTRYPTLLRELYQGELDSTSAQAALAEIRQVRRELGGKRPQFAIWDIEDLHHHIPKGPQVWEKAPNLSEYFRTASGRNFLEVLEELLELLEKKGGTARLLNIK